MNILITFKTNIFITFKNKISIDFQATALHFAILRENIEIVKLLLNRPEININFFILFDIFIAFQNEFFYEILKQIF